MHGQTWTPDVLSIVWFDSFLLIEPFYMAVCVMVTAVHI